MWRGSRSFDGTAGKFKACTSDDEHTQTRTLVYVLVTAADTHTLRRGFTFCRAVFRDKPGGQRLACKVRVSLFLSPSVLPNMVWLLHEFLRHTCCSPAAQFTVRLQHCVKGVCLVVCEGDDLSVQQIVEPKSLRSSWTLCWFMLMYQYYCTPLLCYYFVLVFLCCFVLQHGVPDITTLHLTV